jgi:FtsZ-binding cell division protein ZapB
MGISDLFEKLINEHGSATILKERVSAFNDQVIELEKENSSLKSENSVLNKNITDLELKNNDIEKEKSICQARLDEIHSIILNENHEKILIAVASYSGQHPATFASFSCMSEQETTVKLNYLYSLGLVLSQPGFIKNQNSQKNFSNPVTMWILSNKGHAYIKAHNLNSKIA